MSSVTGLSGVLLLAFKPESDLDLLFDRLCGILLLFRGRGLHLSFRGPVLSRRIRYEFIVGRLLSLRPGPCSVIR